MTRLDDLEQRVYELECVLKHYPKPFNIPAWMDNPYNQDQTATTNTDGTIDVDWDYEL